MDKRTEFNNALKEAVKSKNQIGTATVRLILAALKERDIEARGKGQAEGISAGEILSMLQSMIKQRQESLDTYQKAGRQDLADREAAEIVIIKTFLPQQMSDEEVKKAVEGLMIELKVADIKDMGRVMAELKARYAGQLDMTKASGLVREKLAS